jgi:diadenosine tetraphosphatase ApaH/serine/threonine PP2A family protein phosphatase
LSWFRSNDRPALKLAILTDLHANREAVEAVLEHACAQGAQRYAFLGDYVGYGADPAWVVDTVSRHVDEGAIAVRGNHDAGVADEPSPTMVPVAREVVRWTRAQLSAAQIQFLQALPLQVVEESCLFVHANAFGPEGWAYIRGRTDAVRSLLATRCRYTFCGHSHEPMLYHLSGTGKAGDFVPVPGVPIPVPPHRQWLVIPGSTGQPRDGNPAASYAMLELDEGLVTYHRVPYDHETAAAKIRAAGLPVQLAERLADGQ